MCLIPLSCLTLLSCDGVDSREGYIGSQKAVLFTLTLASCDGGLILDWIFEVHGILSISIKTLNSLVRFSCDYCGVVPLPHLSCVGVCHNHLGARHFHWEPWKGSVEAEIQALLCQRHQLNPTVRNGRKLRLSSFNMYPLVWPMLQIWPLLWIRVV